MNRLSEHFLPTPVSPSSSTVAGVAATYSAWASAWRIARLPDTISRELRSSRTRGSPVSTEGAGSRALQLVERAPQRRVAGLSHQGVVEDARDDPQLLDIRGRPVVFARRGTERQAGGLTGARGQRHGEHRRRLDALPQEGAAIDGVFQLVEPREERSFARQQRRGGEWSQLRLRRVRSQPVRIPVPAVRNLTRLAAGRLPQHRLIELQFLADAAQAVPDGASTQSGSTVVSAAARWAIIVCTSRWVLVAEVGRASPRRPVAATAA